MTLAELRCTRCNAPVDATEQDKKTFKCRYCGATLVVQEAPPAQVTKTEVNRREVVSAAPVVLPDEAVFLENVGANKIDVVKVVRTHMDMGLKQALQLVEKAPCELAPSMEGARARAFREALAEVGAVVR